MKNILTYCGIFVSIVLFIMWPPLLWYKKIIFDEIYFINEWIESLCEGIIIAFLFYVIIKIHDNVKDKKEDKNSINEMINIINDIKRIVDMKHLNEISLLDYKITLCTYIPLRIHNVAKRTKLQSIVETTDFMDVKSQINNFDTANTYTNLSNHLSNIINTLKQI